MHKLKLLGHGPITRPRAQPISMFIGANAALYLYYKYIPGHAKMNFRAMFTKEPGSSSLSVLTSHFTHTNVALLLCNSAVMYTIGNYHLLHHGVRHLAAIFAVGALGGYALTHAQIQWTGEGSYAGGTGGSAGLIIYNAFRNPAWFSSINPYALIGAISLYAAYTGDRAVFGGMMGGYLSYLLLL